MTDYYLTSIDYKQQELDEDLVGAGLAVIVFTAIAAAIIIAAGLWTHVLSMAAGAWLHKRLCQKHS